MDPRRDSVATAVLQLAIPLLAAAYLIALAILPGGPMRIALAPGTGLLAVDVAVALGLLLAGVASWLGAGSIRVGLLAICGGATWLSPYLAIQPTGPDIVRLLGVGEQPLMLPLIVGLVTVAAGLERTSRRVRIGVALIGGVAIALAIIRVATYNPFLEPDCPGSCAPASAIVDLRPAGHLLLRQVLAGFGVVSSLGLTLVTARRLADGTFSGRTRRTLLAGGAILGAASAMVRTLDFLREAQLGEPLGLSPNGLTGTLALLVDLGALVLIGGLSWAAVEVLLQRVRLRRVAGEVEAAPAPGTLQVTLAKALGDPSIEVGYWVADRDHYVGADGGPFETGATPGTAVTAVERLGTPIALVRHRAGVDSTALVREIGPGMLVALDNERLRAVSLAQLAELRSSRSRIVERGDRERRRIERNLHDGAQQRLLAIAFELRLERLTAERAGDTERARHLGTAEAAAMATIDELRRLAQGIHPAVLSQAGLVPALESLAEDATVPVKITMDIADRIPETVEVSAYQVVVEALSDVVQRGAGSMEVRVERLDGSLRIETSDDATEPSEPPIRLSDRVGAAGGNLEVGLSSTGVGTTFRVVLPFA